MAALAGARVLGLDPNPTSIDVRQAALTLAVQVRSSPTLTGCDERHAVHRRGDDPPAAMADRGDPGGLVA